MNRALLLVAGWVGQAVALWLSTSRRPLVAEIVALRERLEKLRAECDLLRARLWRIEPHSRPHYKPTERLAILWHRARYGMSVEATAKAFLVTHQTVINWLKEIRSGVQRLVHARKPINALPDLVGEIALFVKREWPRWGTRRIAGIPAGLRLQASRTSVQRILRRPLPRGRRLGRGGRARPLRPTRPRHVFVVDFTRVGGFFRSVVVGAVLDAFSRKLLSLRVSAGEPDAAFACRLLAEAIRAEGRPTWVVTDRGTQFTSRRFKVFLRRRRIGRRYAAVGDANLARIDRFWRTLKTEAVPALFLYRPLRTIERQLQLWGRWYGRERPHAALGLRTPEQVHNGRRRREGRRLQRAVLEVGFMDRERRLPVFRLRHAA